MPADALRSLQVLTQTLGRRPTLTEILQFLGNDPAGTPMAGPPAGPVQLQDEPGPAFLRPPDARTPLSDFLHSEELMRDNPEIAQRREELIRELLFGIPSPQLGMFGSPTWPASRRPAGPSGPLNPLGIKPANKPIQQVPFSS